MSLLRREASRCPRRRQESQRAKPVLEHLEDRLVPSGFADDFEGSTLNSFWATRTDSGSITFPSTAQVHGGSQSVQLNSTVTGANKYLWLSHTFSPTVYGRFSVWMYDTGADVGSSNAMGLFLADGPGQNIGHGIYVPDYDLGPGRDGSTYVWQVNNIATRTSVDRTRAWHHFSIDSRPDGTTFKIDGITVGTQSSGIAIGHLTLSMYGPSWRPAFTTFFDDFEYVPFAPNTPPTVNAGPDQATTEGMPVSWSGSFTDPDADTWNATVDYGDGAGPQPLTLNANKTFTLAHTYAQNGTYTVTVRVTDSQGAVGTDTVTVTVGNTAPVLTSFATSSPDCGMAGEGQPVTISAAFTDAGVRDTHTALVNWGDGSPLQEVRVTESNGSGTVSGLHAYARGGIYTVTLTLRDSGGLAVTRTAAAVIVGAGVQDGVLRIIGTRGNDLVVVDYSEATVELAVNANFLGGASRSFRLADVQRIEAYLCDGNDRAVVGADVRVPTLLVGDAGNDFLIGGAVSNILVGGPGDDYLSGGGLSDLLIGGLGADLVGGLNGEDLLVAGPTAYDGDPAALLAILREWTRTDIGYDQRINHVVNGGGLNGSVVLNATTVLDDAARDQLFGGPGRDAYFCRRSGISIPIDRIFDLGANEFVLDTTRR